MNTIVGVLLLIIPFSSSQSEKWVWGKNDNTRIVSTEKRYNGDLTSFSKPLFQANSNYNEDRRYGNNKIRYEVTEPTYGGTDNTYRPRPPDQYRPDNRPIRPIDNYRPTNRPYENEYRPVGNGYKPPNGDYYLHGLRPGVGTNGKPILTGPTPSWVENGHSKYRDYDICKCVHSFNCNSPGIKFGSCDEDKQYCCYKSKQSEGHGINEKPITNVYERPRPRPVLAGPGGPIDGLEKPYQIPERPYRQYPDRDSERELDQAYKKGLASAIQQVYSRPTNYYDREYRPNLDLNSNRELNEAYKKGLSSAIYQVNSRPISVYDRENYRDYYTSDRDFNRRPFENYKSSHPSKYGLYYPSDAYGRSSNSTIEAIN